MDSKVDDHTHYKEQLSAEKSKALWLLQRGDPEAEELNSKGTGQWLSGGL